MTRAAIVRLRASCDSVNRMLTEAENALAGSAPDVYTVCMRLARARHALRIGVQESFPPRDEDDPTVGLFSPAPMPVLRRCDPDGLVCAMPTLVRKGCHSYADLESAWAADGPCWSSGEQHAARFVLHVVAGEPFDLGAAVHVWDHLHLAVFRAWAHDPWTGGG
jgi:hypothetical protein